MPENRLTPEIRARLSQAVAGFVAALALWALAETWSVSTFPDMARLGLLTFVLVHAGVSLAMSGTVDLLRSLVGAFLISVPATVLALSVGSRFDVATNALDHPNLVSAMSTLVFVATPFLAVWLKDTKRWNDYSLLFETAWEITTRFLLVWVFLALVWLVLFLSDALLDLVKIGLVDIVMRTGWLAFGLSGAVIGFGLAVIHEVREKVAPFPLLRLLRLLVPVMLGVVSIFLIALPLRGLTGLFGDLSSAAILMVTASAAIALISTAVDRDDAHAIQTAGIVRATRMLAILLPILVGLAIWALAVRVSSYGWTPDRMLAAVIAGLLAVYATGYAGLALVGENWQSRLRQCNVGFAILLVCLAAIWLTPVLDGYRISTASQVSRYDAATAGPDELPIWEMAHDWGKSGDQGLEQLATMARVRNDQELLRTIDRARRIESRYQFSEPDFFLPSEEIVPELLAKMPVAGEGGPLDANDLTDVPAHQLETWHDGCLRVLPNGRPGCLFLRGAFSPVADADGQAFVLYLDADGFVRVTHLLRSSNGDLRLRAAGAPAENENETFPIEVLMQAQSGQFAIVPSGQTALDVAGKVIAPRE